MAFQLSGSLGAYMHQEKWLECSSKLEDVPSEGSHSSQDTVEEEMAAFELDVHLKQLQAAAKSIGGGVGLKHLGPQGFNPFKSAAS